MVAVGDDEFLIGHGGLNRGYFLRVGHDPEAMCDPVLVVDFCGGRRGGFGFGENRVHAFLRIGVEHEELAGVGARVAKEFETIGFGAGEGVLVAEDNPGGIFFEFSRADEAAASAAFGSARHGEFLRVGVKGWSGVLHDDIF